eukprot:CAMPEP_0179022988 /NCGR_PEP_ID=MMETSP0796-20121207/6698_1 /TAXON_ID=73915 /ORGANISM="Pyrodinium bahamense, Strain pbaha01" /LENGTH=306 /DNA_ID=CAMNT_0020718885 /DNA_START=103 /DNA_END=1023 /DNA_ORIENTATION=+
MAVVLVVCMLLVGHLNFKAWATLSKNSCLSLGFASRAIRCRPRSVATACAGNGKFKANNHGSVNLDEPDEEGLVRVEVPMGPGKGNLSVWQDAGMAEKIAEDTRRPVTNAALLLSRAADASIAFAMKGAPEETGLAVWPAAAFLGQFLVNCPSFVRGKSVVELGCGVGVPGICAAVAGAREVLFTDLDVEALNLARRNVADSGITCPVSFAEVDWSAEETWPKPLPPCDVIIAADILFFQDVHKDLIRFCDALLPDDGRALICDPRKRLMRPGFMEKCQDADLEVGTMFETEDMVLLNAMRLVAPP